jgi:hypothetical protein
MIAHEPLQRAGDSLLHPLNRPGCGGFLWTWLRPVERQSTIAEFTIRNRVNTPLGFMAHHSIASRVEPHRDQIPQTIYAQRRTGSSAAILNAFSTVAWKHLWETSPYSQHTIVNIG